MVNQNPQPELYTTRHGFDVGATVGNGQHPNKFTQANPLMKKLEFTG